MGIFSVLAMICQIATGECVIATTPQLIEGESRCKIEAQILADNFEAKHPDLMVMARCTKATDA